MIAVNKPFPLGQVVATPGALEALTASGQTAADFLDRHAGGDWGDVDEHDRQANEDALVNDERLLSVYHTKQGERIWVITERDRSVTTLLLPNEY